MTIKTRLCWTADHSRIVPKGHPDAADPFAREGAEVSAEVVAQYGLEAYVGGGIMGNGSGEALPPIESHPVDEVQEAPATHRARRARIW